MVGQIEIAKHIDVYSATGRKPKDNVAFTHESQKKLAEKIGSEASLEIKKLKNEIPVRIVKKGDTLGAIISGFRQAGIVDKFSWGMDIEYRDQKGNSQMIKLASDKWKTLLQPGQVVKVEKGNVVLQGKIAVSQSLKKVLQKPQMKKKPGGVNILNQTYDTGRINLRGGNDPIFYEQKGQKLEYGGSVAVNKYNLPKLVQADHIPPTPGTKETIGSLVLKYPIRIDSDVVTFGVFLDDNLYHGLDESHLKSDPGKLGNIKLDSSLKIKNNAIEGVSKGDPIYPAIVEKVKEFQDLFFVEMIGDSHVKIWYKDASGAIKCEGYSLNAQNKLIKADLDDLDDLKESLAGGGSAFVAPGKKVPGKVPGKAPGKVPGKAPSKAPVISKKPTGLDRTLPMATDDGNIIVSQKYIKVGDKLFEFNPKVVTDAKIEQSSTLVRDSINIKTTTGWKNLLYSYHSSYDGVIKWLVDEKVIAPKPVAPKFSSNPGVDLNLAPFSTDDGGVVIGGSHISINNKVFEFDPKVVHDVKIDQSSFFAPDNISIKLASGKWETYKYTVHTSDLELKKFLNKYRAVK